jgi:hypothetical protein
MRCAANVAASDRSRSESPTHLRQSKMSISGTLPAPVHTITLPFNGSDDSSVPSYDDPDFVSRMSTSDLASALPNMTAAQLGTTDWSQWLLVTAPMFTTLLQRLGHGSTTMLEGDSTPGEGFIEHWAAASTTTAANIASVLEYLPKWAVNAALDSLNNESMKTVLGLVADDGALKAVFPKLTGSEIVQIPPEKIVTNLYSDTVVSSFAKFNGDQRLAIYREATSLCPGAYQINIAPQYLEQSFMIWQAPLPLSPVEVASHIATLSADELKHTRWEQWASITSVQFTALLLRLKNDCSTALGTTTSLAGRAFVYAWAKVTPSRTLASVYAYLPPWCKAVVTATILDPVIESARGNLMPTA